MPRTKPKAIKLMLVTAILLAICYGAVFFVGKHYINAEEIRKLVISKVETKLQRKVSMADDLEFSISWDMSPRIKISGLTISNVAGSSSPTMLSVDSLNLKFNLLYLLFKEMHVTHLELVKPVMHLETTKGKNNWDFENSKDDSSEDKSSLHIGEVSIQNGTVVYTENNNKPTTVSLQSFSFSSNDSNTNFNFDLEGSINNIPITATASADLGGHQINFKLKNLQSGKSNLSGYVYIKNNYKDISGEFNSSLIRLSDFPSTSSASNMGGEYTVPAMELPLSYFKDAEIDLPIKIKTLELTKLSLTNVNINITAKDNLLDITFKPALELASGHLSTDLNYNLKSPNPSLSMNVKASGLKLEAILNMFMDKAPIVGSDLTINADLHSTGTKLNDLVNNLNGKMLATASAGKYLNSTNLLTAMITFDRKQSSTDLTCAVMNFKVQNGVATANNGIGIEAASVNVIGNGKIDLRNGRINFSIKPESTSNSPIDLSQFSVAQLVDVSGTISEPKVELNPIGLLTSAGGAVAKGLGKIGGGFTGGLGSIASGIMGKNNPITNNPITSSITGNSKASTANPCKTALGN